MVYLRGHPSDFDGWAEAGCPGWDYESVLPYFRRMEMSPMGIRATGGTDGPMVPAPAASEVANPLSQVFLDAAVAVGVPLTDDFTAPTPRVPAARSVDLRWQPAEHGRRLPESPAWQGQPDRHDGFSRTPTAIRGKPLRWC